MLISILFLVGILVLSIITHKLRSKKNSLEQMKMTAWIILITVIFIFLNFIWSSIENYYYNDKIVIIDVVKRSGERTYQQIEFPNYSYITGNEGKLYYKTQSFGEQIIFLKLANQSIIHFLVYLIIGLIIFLFIKSASNKKSFSQKISKSFMSIGTLILILPMIDYNFQEFIVGNILSSKTNHVFRLQTHFDILPFTIPGIIIMLSVYFLNKGKDLQEELELTI